MDIERLSRRALDDIKKLVTLPEKGIVAGGSLGNLIWEYVSGNKAIINDVDIFLLKEMTKEEIETLNAPDSLQKKFYNKIETKLFDTYNGLGFTNSVKECYYIDSVSNDGLLNIINYKSENKSPQIIINSFDINCTQISYSIEEDKFYWADEFVEFLKTGKLKLANLMSPCHSAIRIVKKENELNAELDNIELRMCQYVLNRQFMDINRRFYSNRYNDTYLKYKEKLSSYFTPRHMKSMRDNMIHNNPDLPEGFELYCLDPVLPKNLKPFSFSLKDLFDMSFEDTQQRKDPKFGFDTSEYFFNTEEFLFFIRNIYSSDDKENLSKYWNKLRPIYNRVDYVDYEPTKDQLEILHGLSQTSSGFIENMKNLKLSEQCRILDSILSRCDKTTAIRILNRCKIIVDQELDDDDVFLMEMLVRKEIHVNITPKVERVFGNGEDENVWSPF